MATTLGRDVLATCTATIGRAKLEGVALLGFKVSWSLRGVQVARADLKVLLETHGFAGYLPPRPPTAKKALKRAIREWATRRGVDSAGDGEEESDEVSGRRQLLREVHRGALVAGDKADGPPPIILALVEEESLSRALGLRYGISHRFHYQPAWGGIDPGELRISPLASGPIADEAQQIKAELEPIWTRHRTLYLNGDVSRITTAIVEGMDSYPTREGGGSYHVGPEWAADLDRLARLIRELPSADRKGRVPRLYADATPDWPLTRANLQEQAFDKLVSEINDAQWSVERSEGQNSDKPGSVRPRTVQGLIATIAEVKRRADLVTEKIGMRGERAERLLSEIDDLGNRARALFPDESRAERADTAGGDFLFLGDGLGRDGMGDMRQERQD